MKGRMLAVAHLALALGATVSQGEWKMRVHEGTGVTEFTVSNIDSLTFCEVTSPIPMVAVPAESSSWVTGWPTAGSRSTRWP